MRLLKVSVASGAVSEPFDAQAVLGALVTALAGLAFEPTHRRLILLPQVGTRMDPHPDPMDPHPDPPWTTAGRASSALA